MLEKFIVKNVDEGEKRLMEIINASPELSIDNNPLSCGASHAIRSESQKKLMSDMEREMNKPILNLPPRVVDPRKPGVKKHNLKRGLRNQAAPLVLTESAYKFDYKSENQEEIIPTSLISGEVQVQGKA